MKFSFLPVTLVIALLKVKMAIATVENPAPETFQTVFLYNKAHPVFYFPEIGKINKINFFGGFHLEGNSTPGERNVTS